MRNFSHVATKNNTKSKRVTSDPSPTFLRLCYSPPLLYESINFSHTRHCIMVDENAPLVTSEQAGMVASGAASLINQSATKIKKAKMDGPLTFRTLGFIGGLAMVVSNGLGIVDRFFSFNFTGSLIAIYGVFFGILSEWTLCHRGVSIQTGCPKRKSTDLMIHLASFSES